MTGLIYSILSAILVGMHLFSIKLLSVYTLYFNYILFFTLLTMILSRYTIYLAMKNTNNPTNVNLILNLSVFVTFFASLYFLKLEKFDFPRYVIGILFIIIGLTFIQMSYM